MTYHHQKHKEKMKQPKIIEYQFVFEPNKGIEPQLQKQALKNMEEISKGYCGTKDSIETLSGDEAARYLKRLSALFKVAYQNIDEAWLKKILYSYIGYLDIIALLGKNIQVCAWDKELNSISFEDMLKLDIDKRNGLPFLGDIDSMIKQIKTEDTSQIKELINQFFIKILDNPEIEISDTDYIKLLQLANKESLSEINTQSLTPLKNNDVDIVDFNRRAATVMAYSFNKASIRTIEIVLRGKYFSKKRLFRQHTPLIEYTKNKEVYIETETKFKNALSYIVTNDAVFLGKSIKQFLKQTYEKDLDVSLKTIDIGLIRRNDQNNWEEFPELNQIKFPEITPFLLIRKQEKKEVKYMVVHTCPTE